MRIGSRRSFWLQRAAATIPTSLRSDTPVAISGMPGVESVTAACDHVCARTTDGDAFCWGNNVFGQLGNGTRTDSAVPVAVKDLANVTSMSAGCFHTCASLGNGAVKCWGRNDDGVLGVEPT